MTAPTVQQIRSIPKVELHVHLEGTFSSERVAELAARHGETPPRSLDRLYEADNLSDFLDTLDWVCGLVRQPDEAEAVAADFAEHCTDQGIVYAEVIVNPTHWSGLDVDALLTAICRGFDRARAAGAADLRLLPSILRQQTADEALALVGHIEALAEPRIVGLSIDGNEAAAGRTGERFAPAYRRAGDLGLGRTAHAGESSGAQGVADALDLLGVSRVDHGVRIIEDPTLVRRAIDEHVTLNVCLTSNCTLLYESIDQHPIAELAATGVRYTINTDDPEVLGVDLCGELGLAAGHLRWTVDDLVAAQHRAIDATFCDDAERTALRRRLDDWASAQPSGA